MLKSFHLKAQIKQWELLYLHWQHYYLHTLKRATQIIWFIQHWSVFQAGAQQFLTAGFQEAEMKHKCEIRGRQADYGRISLAKRQDEAVTLLSEVCSRFGCKDNSKIQNFFSLSSPFPGSLSQFPSPAVLGLLEVLREQIPPGFHTWLGFLKYRKQVAVVRNCRIQVTGENAFFFFSFSWADSFFLGQRRYNIREKLLNTPYS